MSVTQRRVTAAEEMRALAHPLRLQLLELLGSEGAFTASEAGRRLGETPANVSWHLRKLAEYGFVRQGEGRGRVVTGWDVTKGGRSMIQLLSNEIARVETEIIGLEDQEIELMEEAELLQGKIREAEKAFQAAKTQSEVQLAGLKTKDDTLRSRIAEIESERAELVKMVDQNLLFQYNRLFASKGGDAECLFNARDAG